MYRIDLDCVHCRRSYSIYLIDRVQSTFDCPRCKVKVLSASPVSGLIYVLSNGSMPGLLKIGRTSRPVSERIDKLSSGTSVPSPFVCEGFFASEDPSRDEQRVHNALNQYKVKGREFFACSVEHAFAVIQSILGVSPIYSSLSDARTNNKCPNCGTDAEFPDSITAIECKACHMMFVPTSITHRR